MTMVIFGNGGGLLSLISSSLHKGRGMQAGPRNERSEFWAAHWRKRSLRPGARFAKQMPHIKGGKGQGGGCLG